MIYLLRLLSLIILLLSINNQVLAEKYNLDAAQQKRANNLYKQIKCPICSGQVIAESDNEISKLMRDSVKMKIAQGYSDEQILKDIEASYGKANVSRQLPQQYFYGVVALLLAAGVITMFAHRSKSKLPTAK